MSLFSGSDAADAATDAATAQQLAGLKAKRGISEGFGTAGEQLTTGFSDAQNTFAPFNSVGQNALNQENLLFDRQAQADFISNDPVTQQNMANAQRAVLNSGAASGDSSGGNILRGLTDASFNVGQQSLQNQQQNIQNGLNFGLGVAGQQAGLQTGLSQALAGLSTTEALQNADLTTGIGAAQAGGIVGAQNAKTQAQSGALNAGLSIAGTLFPAISPLTGLAQGAVNNAAAANSVGTGGRR